MIAMQLAAGMLYQTADDLAKGNISSIEASVMLLAIAQWIQGIENAIPTTQPPFFLQGSWQQIQKPYSQMKQIFKDWFYNDITSKEVLQQLPPVLESMEQILNNAERTLAFQYRFPKEELTAQRQEIMRSIPDMFATPTPTATP